jgi:hypothetical protein
MVTLAHPPRFGLAEPNFIIPSAIASRALKKKLHLYLPSMQAVRMHQHLISRLYQRPEKARQGLALCRNPWTAWVEGYLHHMHVVRTTTLPRYASTVYLSY